MRSLLRSVSVPSNGSQIPFSAHRFLRRLGLDIVRYPSARFPEERRQRLLRELDIGLMLDVGANAGQYASLMRRDGYGGRIVSFEPLIEPYSRLERAAMGDPLWETMRLALAEQNGQASMNVAGDSRASSLLAVGMRDALAPAAATVRQETVETRRLDDIREELAWDRRVYLKLDVQGAELAALEGAERSLPDVQALEAELSFVELYDGQPLFAEVVTFLRDRGFVLIQLENELADPRTGALLQMNGIFSRTRW